MRVPGGLITMFRDQELTSIPSILQWYVTDYQNKKRSQRSSRKEFSKYLEKLVGIYRNANKPRPVFSNRDAIPFTWRSRCSAEFSVAHGVAPVDFQS